MRALGFARAYGGLLLLLAIITTLTTAALMLVASLARSGGDPLVALPLVIVGPAVLALVAVDLARHRSAELQLARVRGVHGAALLRVAAGPALLAVLVGVLGAVVVTAGVVAWGPAGWPLPGLLGRQEALLAVVCLVVAGVVVALGSWMVARVAPVLTQGHGTGRRLLPGGVGGALDSVGLIGLVVVSVVALYQAGRPATVNSPLVLAGTAVVGLAIGHAVVVVRRLLVPAVSRTIGTGSVLGVRRALDGGLSGRLRITVACVVVAAAAWSAASAAMIWGEESERLRVAADLQVALPEMSALDTLLLTRRLDPQGRWLMAAAVDGDRSEAAFRVAYLDLARYSRVSGALLADSVGGLDEVLAPLRDATAVQTLVGRRVVAHGRAPGSVPARGARRLQRPVVELRYLSDLGYVESAIIAMRPTSSMDLVGSAPIANCARGCVALSLTVTGRGEDESGALNLETLVLGGTPLVGGGSQDGWVASQGAARSAEASEVGDSLVLRPGIVYVPGASLEPQPVLVAGDPQWSDAAAPMAPGVDGAARAVAPLGSRAALPLVVGAGILGDLPAALTGSRGSTPGLRSLVLIRADTPAAVLGDLKGAGAGSPTSASAQGRSALAPKAFAELRMRQLIAGTAALLALLCLVAGAGAMARSSAADARALRLVGVGRPELHRALGLEAVLLALTSATAAAIGTWLAISRVVVPGALVPRGPTLLGPPGEVLLGALLAAAVGLGVAWTVLVVIVRGPSIRTRRR